MMIRATTLDDHQAHHLLKSCVVPRPIAWISTIGADGVANAAPYSCYTFVATRPPMVVFSVSNDGPRKKDTLVNVETTKAFVVNVVTEDHAAPMNTTADNFPAEVDEIAAVGFTAINGTEVAAPRIAECPIQLECRVVDQLRLGESQHVLIVGQVLVFHIDDSLYRDGEIDQMTLRPLARLAGNQYARVTDIFELPRPWQSSMISS